MGNATKARRQNRTITVDFQDQSTYFQLISDGKAFVEFVLAFILSIGFQLHHKANCTGGGSLTRLAHLYNLIPYQRRAQHAGLCGVQVEGGRVPTSDWILNLQILTSGGYQYLLNRRTH